MLRIAIVGMGWAGKRHVEAIQESGGKLQVAALVDSDAAHLTSVAEELGISSTVSQVRRRAG